MSATRRHADPAGRLSTQAPRSSGKKTPRSSTKRADSKGQGEDGEELIVTRGLQELLDAEMQAKHTAPTGRPSKTRRAPGHAPNFVFCYLCGRQFGKSSIDIHRPQCYLKKMIQWERGDAATRGPKPVDPETHEKRVQEQLNAQSAMDGAPVGCGAGAGGRGGKKDAMDINAYNMVQMDAYNKESLMPCPNCGRTFLPDRLQVHLRSCKPGHTAKPLRPAAAAPAAAPAATAATAASKGGAQACAAPAAAAPSGTEDQPIRASGAYVLPQDADIDAVPPSSTGSSRTRRAVSASEVRAAPGAPASGENTPIRASGRYALPTDATEDSVPPAVSPPSSTTKASGSKPRRVSIIDPASGHIVDSDADSDDAIQFTEEAHPHATASERRLSMSAEREAMSESSTPYRPAAMELSVSEVGSDAVMTDAVADEVEEAEVVAAPAATTSQAAPASSASATRRAGAAATRRSVPAADASLEGEETEVKTPRKAIPLNNVSRFKNVQSKLKQQMTQQAEASQLAPCQFCGRTFAPDRVSKHESVCLERNKVPTPGARKAKTAVKKPASLSNAQPASTPSAAGPAKPMAKPAVAGAPVSKESPVAQFCDQCGSKRSAAAQKFCAQCGNKL